MNNAITLPKPQKISSWRNATWAEYLQRIESPNSEQERIFFNQNKIWIDGGNESINHCRFNELFTMIFGIWFLRQIDVNFDLLGGCRIEKPQKNSSTPDQILYVGGDSPRCPVGETGGINLDYWRIPDLVAEIADTTLAIDLDEKKQLYLALGIPEYWVIDVRGRQIWFFLLVEERYQESSESKVLQGLSIDLLEQTLARMDDDNGNVALWFADQIKKLPVQ